MHPLKSIGGGIVLTSKTSTSNRRESLRIKVSSTALQYIRSLDKPTRKRIGDKLNELARDPLSIRGSKPLSTVYRRTCRIGPYRILFEVLTDDKVLLVSDVGPRGQIYKRA